MNQSTRFKQTELGEIPEEWEVERLEKIAEVYAGSSAPQEQKYFEGGIYSFVRVQDLARYGQTRNLVETTDKVNDMAVKELSLVLAPKGTIVFPKSGAALEKNHRAILGTDAYIVSHLAAVEVNRDVADTEFVFWWLCRVDMAAINPNPGYPSIRLQEIKALPVPLPPLEEQKRIAGVLRLVDEIIDRTRKIVELYEKAKKHALSRLLTKGIGHTHFKQTELGEIPEEWEVKRLGDVGNIRQGRTLRRKDYKDSGRFKMLKVRDISETGEINWYINEKGCTDEDLGEEFSLQSGDILVLSASHSEELVGQKIGFIHTLPSNFEKVFFVAELLRVRVFPEKAVPYFIYSALVANKSGIKPLVKGGHLYPQSLAQLQIPLPPLDEQKQIAEILSTIDKAIDNERRYLEALGKLKKWLLNNLLTGKVRLPEWVGDALKQVFPEG